MTEGDEDSDDARPGSRNQSPSSFVGGSDQTEWQRSKRYARLPDNCVTPVSDVSIPCERSAISADR